MTDVALSETSTTTPTLLTFDDLVALADQHGSKARTPDSIARWERVSEVARSLAGTPSADDVVTGRTWRLQRVRIAGYQGVGTAEPLEIDVDPSPGVTVVHGPNGSGKSSVADAIETALRGRPRDLPAGSGGQAPLWERPHRGRDAEEATIELTLRSGAERLELSCRIDAAGHATSTTRLVAADGTITEVDPAASTWRSALAGHRPVFGYAAVERQVQLSRNLKDFLEPLLAFGGCFDELKTAVADAGAPAIRARATWDSALREAQASVAAVDRDRARPDLTSLAALSWPEITDDPDAWLAAVGLTETGAAVAAVTMAHGRDATGAAELAATALDDLEKAETSLHARLAGPLTDLHTQAGRVPDPGLTCPVCTTTDVGWLTALGEGLRGLTATEVREREFRDALDTLRRAVDAVVPPVESVLAAPWCVTEARADADTALSVCHSLLDALDADGRRATPRVRDALRAAHRELTSTAWTAAVTDLARQSDHRTQWARARRAAVDGFVDIWRDTRAEGAAASSWDAAGKCVRTLQKTVRGHRIESLHAVADDTVQKLLHDVGLTITGLSISDTKADMALEDEGGDPVALSMLSAGQRNALLLAPLLAVSRGGPFGFLVLDDPVHAFDQVRVDRLARIVGELAADRRVIVLTHDERLTEHLLAHSPGYDARAISRDHTTGVVSAPPTQATWRVLLDDARSALTLVPTAQRGAVTVTDLVRGLCRMAVDDALRRFVLHQAVGAHRDPAPDLAQLDAVGKTRDRFTVASGLHPGHPDLAAADTLVQPHLGDWNRAAHGNAPRSGVTVAEVDTTDAACRRMLGLP